MGLTLEAKQEFMSRLANGGTFDVINNEVYLNFTSVEFRYTAGGLVVYLMNGGVRMYEIYLTPDEFTTYTLYASGDHRIKFEEPTDEPEIISR